MNKPGNWWTLDGFFDDILHEIFLVNKRGSYQSKKGLQFSQLYDLIDGVIVFESKNWYEHLLLRRLFEVRGSFEGIQFSVCRNGEMDDIKKKYKHPYVLDLDALANFYKNSD